MNKEKYLPSKSIGWAKHVRNNDVPKQKFSKLRRRSVKLMILKNKNE